MITVFKHSLGKSRGAILGWGLTLALLGMMFVPFYDTIAEDVETWENLMSAYPQEILDFFGGSGGPAFTTPEGFLSLEYFSFMPIVLGIYALLAGSGLLAGDEESGVLDLVVAQPVSRSGHFWGRLLALWLSILVILFLGWGGVMLATTYSLMELDAVQLLIPFGSMGALVFFFVGLALLLSMVLPSRRTAGMVSGIVLVGGFFINGLANLNDTLADVAPFLPHNYYQGETWVDGLNGGNLAVLLGFGLAFMLTAWWAFLRRDIRVGGEGGWTLKLPALGRKKTAEA